MLLKVDWLEYLHRIRQQEIGAIFSYFGDRRWRSGLELGAGDGFQTTLLANYCDSLISTDLNFKRIKEELRVTQVNYQPCDADRLAGVFLKEQFDLVFSSNLIEHLSDPQGFLLNTRAILATDGWSVHVVPSRLIKVSYLVLHYLNLFILALDRFIGLFKGKKVFRGENISLENNLNRPSAAPPGRLKKFLLPPIHGNFHSHTEEFIKFGRSRWEKLFKQAGFRVVHYIKGPVFSGYGFGWDHWRRFFEGWGLCSEHIFILKKQ